MTFEEWFELELLKSKNPHTIVKYKDDFRDYYKEVMQERLLHYHGGRYRDPEFQRYGFKEEASSCAEQASAYLANGLYLRQRVVDTH